MATLRKMLKRWVLNAPDRYLWTTSDATKVWVSNDHEGVLRVSRNALGLLVYPTTTGLYLQGPATAPAALKQWLAFEAIADLPKDRRLAAASQQVTSILYRVHNGTHYWHNGVTWVVATDPAAHWNTEAQINANLSSAITAVPGLIRLGMVANLRTSVGDFTPRLKELKLLYSADIPSFAEDVLFNSLIASMKANIRPLSDYTLTLATTGTSFDLDSYPLEGGAGWNIVGIDAVYNHTADPTHTTDILSSYNTSTHVVTLTGSATAGAILWVRFIYQPQIAFRTDQDFVSPDVGIIEADATPGIYITSFTESGSELPNDDYIINRSADPAAGTKIPAPIRVDVIVDVEIRAKGSVDWMRLKEAFWGYIQNTPLLTLAATDEQARIRLRDKLSGIGSPNDTDLNVGRVRIEISDILYWLKVAITAGDPQYPGQGYGINNIGVVINVNDLEANDAFEINAT